MRVSDASRQPRPLQKSAAASGASASDAPQEAAAPGQDLTPTVPTTRLLPTVPPPDHYYAGNLLLLIESVHRQYDDLLAADERAFGDAVATASAGAQRLFARIVGRRGPIVRVDTLAYPEVPERDAALAELVDAGLLIACPDFAPEFLFRRARRAELERWFPVADARGSKTVLIEAILARYPAPVVRARFAWHCPWVALADPARLELYRLLFFGDRHSDLAAFVVRDLGIVRYEDYALCRERRLFPDRAALDAWLALTRIGDYVEQLGPTPPPELAAVVVEALWHPARGRLLERRRSRILNHLGRRLERGGAFDDALACYGRSSHAPARERTTRILNRLGDAAAVARLRAAIRRQPRTALERDFAERFQTVRGTARCPITDLPWAPSYAARVEAAAATVLAQRGGTVWHLENALPLGLFGLAYWEWVFAPVDGMFVNAFQSAPLDLFWPDFLVTRRGLCDDPLRLDDGALRAAMLATAASRRGVANRLVDWRALDAATLERVLAGIPMADVRTLLAIIALDLDRARTGFPDLTAVYDDGTYEFVEVKGPTDQLRSHQRLWIDKLGEAGLPVRLLRFR